MLKRLFAVDSRLGSIGIYHRFLRMSCHAFQRETTAALQYLCAVGSSEFDRTAAAAGRSGEPKLSSFLWQQVQRLHRQGTERFWTANQAWQSQGARLQTGVPVGSRLGGTADGRVHPESFSCLRSGCAPYIRRERPASSAERATGHQLRDGRMVAKIPASYR